MKVTIGKFLSSILISIVLVFISAFIVKYTYNNILNPLFNLEHLIDLTKSFWVVCVGRATSLLFILPYAESILKNNLGAEADTKLVEKSAFQFGVLTAIFIFVWFISWFI